MISISRHLIARQVTLYIKTFNSKEETQNITSKEESMDTDSKSRYDSEK